LLTAALLDGVARLLLAGGLVGNGQLLLDDFLDSFLGVDHVDFLVV
jgi:hypothetical protein